MGRLCRLAEGRLSRLLAAALLLGVALQAILFLAVLRLGHVPPLGDAAEYNVLASNLVDHRALSLSLSPPYVPTVKRTPVYPLLLAAVYRAVGQSFTTVCLLQFVMLAANAWMLFRLCGRFMETAAAACAAVLFAIYLPNGLYATMLFSETLTTLLVISFVLLLGATTPRPLALGLLAGVSTLLRPSFMVLFVAAVAIGKGWRHAVWVAAAFGLCVVPWMVRNYAVAGQLMLVTGGSYSFYQSSLQYSGQLAYEYNADSHVWLKQDQLRRYDDVRAKVSATSWVQPQVQLALLVEHSYLQDGLQCLATVPMAHVLVSLPGRVLHFWATCGGTYLWSTTPADAWLSPLQYARASVALWRVERVQHAAIALLVLAGAWLSRKRLRQQWPLWFLPLYITLVHCVLHCECRYTVPTQIFLFPYAGYALSSLFSPTVPAASPSDFERSHHAD